MKNNFSVNFALTEQREGQDYRDKRAHERHESQVLGAMLDFRLAKFYRIAIFSSSI